MVFWKEGNTFERKSKEIYNLVFDVLENNILEMQNIGNSHIIP